MSSKTQAVKPIKKSAKTSPKSPAKLVFKPATKQQIAEYIRWCRMVDNIEKRKVHKLVIRDEPISANRKK